MKQEKSCGAVIVENGKVLLVHQTNDFWSFPKGHIEGNETEPETAIREVKEETGLNVVIDESKRFELSYVIEDLNIHKTVILFLAHLASNNHLRLQEEEISEAKWVPLKDVDDLLVFDRWHEAWRQILPEIKNQNLNL